MINFDHITIQYKKRIIIKDFSASIKKGEFIAILGANGAGKSTLLRALLGRVKLTQGNIVILGNQLQSGDPRIGYMPQMRHTLNSRFSGRAKLSACFSGHRYGLPIVTKNNQDRIDEVINMVNADHYADRPFSELSGGERQRLLLAQALLNDPEILLLDEPLASLDPKQQQHLIQLIAKIQTQFSKTILFTAHDVNMLLPAIQRVIYLAHGKCAIGKVDEVINTKRLSDLYDTKIEVIKHHHRIFVLNHEDVSAPYNNACIHRID